MNRAYDVTERHHFLKHPGELCGVDLYRSLPTSCGNVRFIFVCYDTFSKYVKLYPLKSATTKACLNKLLNHYFVNVIKPKVVLSDNGSQFRSPVWTKKLKEQDVCARFSAIRHPESNPSERVMRELSKFFRIYCHGNHKKWVELLPHIEGWLNITVASSIGYSPLELMFGCSKPSVFDNKLPKPKQNTLDVEEMDTELERAFSRMKRKAAERERRRKRGNAIWNPKTGDKVLVKGQNQSDAAKGIIDKFTHMYQGPYIINKVLPHSSHELVDSKGRLRGEFNKRQLKPYRTDVHRIFRYVELYKKKCFVSLLSFQVCTMKKKNCEVTKMW